MYHPYGRHFNTKGRWPNKNTRSYAICKWSAIIRNALSLLCLLALTYAVSAQLQTSIPFPSAPLNENGDLSSLMVERVDQFLTTETKRMEQARSSLWHRDFSTNQAFDQSIKSQRELLSRRLGVVDARVVPEMELMTDSSLRTFSLQTSGCVIHAVRWKVLDGLFAEGLLLQPKGTVRARVVIIPEADVLPEVLAGLQNAGNAGYNIARQMAESGWEVVMPVLTSRDDTFSGNPSLGLFTNMPHREWIYRQGYELGRHVIGYELQKIFSAIDWFENRNKVGARDLPIGVAGYGEGGLLALNAAALDTRIASTLVSGYFDKREEMWREPIYHNVFGFLKYFSDAELAVMAWPRNVVVEQSKGPKVPGPPKTSKGRSGASPGIISTPDVSSAKNEWERARAMLPKDHIHLRWCANGISDFQKAFSSAALRDFATGLHLNFPDKFSTRSQSIPQHNWIDVEKRQERCVREMEQTVQQVLVLSERTRNQNFWQSLKGDAALQRPVKAAFREQFSNQIGSLPIPTMPINPKARLLQKTEKWTSYEVVMDVWPGVFAWGILLIPNNIKSGEKHPVVVCQHGLEGVPMDVVTTDTTAQNYRYYQGWASRLAERGYIVFAPHNLYRGGDKFRVLQRKANPLGLTLFSVIIGQHQRILEWLKTLSFVDPERIGFYGLSYGGKSAMRIPAVVQGYALSICSADFNEWIRKCASTNYRFSYLFTGEYDMPEWDLGHTFSYAEMAALIAPRPFMVERGHYDNVATDEWVGYEFAKVQRHYDLIGLPTSTRIEYFAGPHTINGVGTFEFLDRYLGKDHEAK